MLYHKSSLMGHITLFSGQVLPLSLNSPNLPSICKAPCPHLSFSHPGNLNFSFTVFRHWEKKHFWWTGTRSQVQVACLACARQPGPGCKVPIMMKLLGRASLIPIMMTLLMMKLLGWASPPWLPGRAPPAKSYLTQLLLPAQPHLHCFLNST